MDYTGASREAQHLCVLVHGYAAPRSGPLRVGNALTCGPLQIMG
jgi:hypothetical protein